MLSDQNCERFFKNGPKKVHFYEGKLWFSANRKYRFPKNNILIMCHRSVTNVSWIKGEIRLQWFKYLRPIYHVLNERNLPQEKEKNSDEIWLGTISDPGGFCLSWIVRINRMSQFYKIIGQFFDPEIEFLAKWENFAKTNFFSTLPTP